MTATNPTSPTSRKLGSADQKLARAISARLIGADAVTLTTTDDGRRWLTDTYIAVAVTGPLAPVRCERLVNGLDDGAYQLTVGRGLVPIVGRGLSPAGVAQHLTQLEVREADGFRVAPTAWLVNVDGDQVALWERGSDAGSVPVGVNAAVAAAWEAELVDEAVIATQTNDLRPIRLAARERVGGTYWSASEQREAEARAAARPSVTVAWLMPVRVELPTVPSFLQPPSD